MDIAIVRRNGLGDLLCALPLILYIKKNISDASVTLFADQWNAPLIRYLPAIDQTAIFSKAGNKYWVHYQMACRHRSQFDLAISAKTSPMKLMNLFLHWLKAKERIAYVDQSWHSRLINRPIPYLPERAKTFHQALKNLHTIAPQLREIPEELYPKLQIPSEIRLLYPCAAKKEPCVLISATTTKPSNRLHVERYAALLNRLYQDLFFSVLIIGQNEDKSRAQAIAARLKMKSSVHFPRKFDEFMIWLDHADLFFVGDGGVAHIGAALGKKVVALFGGVSPIEWHPLGKQVATFYHPHHVDGLSNESIHQALSRLMNQDK